jgi:hypothetical protein
MEDEVTDTKEIAVGYLKSWFVVDVLAIFPVDLILAYYDESAFHEANALARAPKIQKVFKVLKVMRLIKLLKLAKNNEKVQQKAFDRLAIQARYERITLYFFMTMYMIHLAGCFWVMIATLDSPNQCSWYQKVQNESTFQKYIQSIYFITATITTVGYGDVNGRTKLEQGYCIALMISGVFYFSMISSSLAAVFSFLDTDAAAV